jgi:hypothetical protein
VKPDKISSDLPPSDKQPIQSQLGSAPCRDRLVVKGMGLIALIHTSAKDVSLPVDFRIYQKTIGIKKQEC